MHRPRRGEHTHAPADSKIEMQITDESSTAPGATSVLLAGYHACCFGGGRAVGAPLRTFPAAILPGTQASGVRYRAWDGPKAVLPQPFLHFGTKVRKLVLFLNLIRTGGFPLSYRIPAYGGGIPQCHRRDGFRSSPGFQPTKAWRIFRFSYSSSLTRSRSRSSTEINPIRRP